MLYHSTLMSWMIATGLQGMKSASGADSGQHCTAAHPGCSDTVERRAAGSTSQLCACCTVPAQLTLLLLLLLRRRVQQYV
jgi:hypothetical protein